MTLTPQRHPGPDTGRPPEVLAPTAAPAARLRRVGAQPWAMAAAVVVAVAGAALSLNGVLRGWAWYPPALTTICVVALAMAVLRSLRAHPFLVALGGFASLAFILTFTFFRRDSIAGFIPSGDTMEQLGRYLRRASETVLAESSPVAPNAGIVLVTCAVLGLVVILVDALAVPLALPATSGLGLVAILVVPAMVKPQSVGVWGFAAAAAGYLMILACSQWFAPDNRTTADTARNPGQFRRAALTGGITLVITLLLPLAVPGFDQGTFPQGSRLNPWGSSTGLNPMISLGNSLRSPSGDGRITYATSASRPPYLRSVTVDRFDGDSWSPDDRDASRRVGVGRMDAGYEILADEQVRQVTAVNTGRFTSPYLPVPYAPDAVNGLAGRWSWDPATLSIKGVDTNSRNQQYVVQSTAPRLTPELLSQSSAPVRGISEEFLRAPNNVPDIVRNTADTVTAGSRTAYAKAMAIQNYLRSVEFTYSLQSPVQGGYDGNGLSVLADFLTQKSGYCIHFASAMAVMARLEGIPSRIAVGYAPGRSTGASVSVPGQGALTEYEVDSRDAHAWPELYFQGLGWVAFEPTPSRGVVPDYAAQASTPGGASTNENNDDLIPSNTATPGATPGATPTPLPGLESAGEPGHPLTLPLYGAAGILLLALIAGSPRMVRAGLRSRRLRSAPALGGNPAAAAWAELRDLATDYGLAPGLSETPRHFSSRLRGSGALGARDDADDAGIRAVAALTADFERQQYGPPAGHAGVAEDGAAPSAAERIAVVQASLRKHSRPGRRLRAEWLPASVMNRWGRIVSAPFHAVLRAAAKPAQAAARSWRTVRDGLRRLRRG
ncbi:transglutaminaseTgpA domain-containing protein [Arthrobacter sp. LjRoot14]|uniref:transglutaminase family protein n=1 Tax=Arthrobacter sp. LjRoot14 TaxID=3342265 RepID=UPI003ECF36CF